MTKPARQQPPQRHDRRDRVTAAADFALLGVAVTLAAAPLLTIGAAAATGSYAARQRCVNGTTPPWRDLGRTFVAWLLPGVSATLVFVTAGGLLAFDLGLLATGIVPGGSAVLAVTSLVVCWFAVISVVTVVQFGRQEKPRWRAAVGWAVRASTRAPHRAVAVLLVWVLAGALAAVIPMVAPLAVGYCLLVTHVVAERLLPPELGLPAGATGGQPRERPAGTEQDRS